jgi:G:T-mismatch repair DNA endonuclease (very short patch repair protein)
LYENTCTNCGKIFHVQTKSQSDPNNRGKFKRACSPECTTSLKSKNLKARHAEGTISGVRSKRTFDREVLLDLFCYKHLKMREIAKYLKTKETTLRREFERLEIPREFHRICPQCSEDYSCDMRCMVDPNSNKFKKFCSRKCFLSSRNQTNTWIEREIVATLDANEIDYIPQFELGRMTIDFIIPSKMIAIEANGDFWHANPAIYGKTKPLHKIHARVIEKDKRKLSQLDAAGYSVYVVWENDLLTNKDETLRAILSVIKSA